MTNPPPTLADRSADYILRHGLLSTGDHILVAVSGGPDSVALLDILASLKDIFRLAQVTVVHFDHRLRGEESDADREFVRMLAAGYGMGFRIGTAEVREYARAEKISIEMAARARRHSFLKETSAGIGASAIALGHTADDQAEEVLLRLLRGSGPAGLKGMLPRTADGLIRPLLFASRGDILEYLRSRGISHRMDSSNLEPFCQRNALRLRVFPLLREIFHPEVARTISRYAELAKDEELWWADQVKGAWDSCGELTESGASLDVETLRGLHPAMLRRVLRYAIQRVRGDLSAIQAVHLEPLYAMALTDMPGRSVRLPGEVEAVQRGGKLLLGIRGPEACPVVQIEELEIPGPGVYEFGSFRFEIELMDAVEGTPSPDAVGLRPVERAFQSAEDGQAGKPAAQESTKDVKSTALTPSPSPPRPGRGIVSPESFKDGSRIVSPVGPNQESGTDLPDASGQGVGTAAPGGHNEILMDADRIRWPLLVRPWKPGDRFFPLGMRGSKKLQDFFTDLKIAREERFKIPILCDKEKICWIAGFRMDERAKIGSETQRLVRVRLTRPEPVTEKAVREKIAEIVETLESAERMFAGLGNISDEAKGLWLAGMEKLAEAIWVHEHKEQGEGRSPE